MWPCLFVALLPPGPMSAQTTPFVNGTVPAHLAPSVGTCSVREFFRAGNQAGPAVCRAAGSRWSGAVGGREWAVGRDRAAACPAHRQRRFFGLGTICGEPSEFALDAFVNVLDLGMEYYQNRMVLESPGYLGAMGLGRSCNSALIRPLKRWRTARSGELGLDVWPRRGTNVRIVGVAGFAQRAGSIRGSAEEPNISGRQTRAVDDATSARRSAFCCGPLALDRINAYKNPQKAGNMLVRDSKSTTNGFSLNQVARIVQPIGDELSNGLPHSVCS